LLAGAPKEQQATFWFKVQEDAVVYRMSRTAKAIAKEEQAQSLLGTTGEAGLRR
jgi:hypothetical protein